MSSSAIQPQRLSQAQYSLDHQRWIEQLATTENLLIIQDLDGVCMGLVNDPLTRRIDLAYVQATAAFDGHFYVLTNGEHIGLRGVNNIVDKAWAEQTSPKVGRYLPGLAAGGVQWQDRQGDVSYPGVSDAELAFLKQVPQRIRQALTAFAQSHELGLEAEQLESLIQASALDNVASPTANLNTFHKALGTAQETYVALQKAMQQLMDKLLQEADQQGLGASFFVHYAPNHGRDQDGKEIIWLSQASESGTTDFQFMLRGAVKEAGVLVLLNRYYGARTGEYPLGEDFNARQAPHEQDALLALAQAKFDPALMPALVGVGDTVTSAVESVESRLVAKRGGSDRNFLHLIQTLGEIFDTDNVVTYVDSSSGELKNRRALKLETIEGQPIVTAGPGDPRDQKDPLRLNVVFPGGYPQYCEAFVTAAQHRAPIS
ncbi:MAG: glucosylglycerol 3-phosphatase [Leptolyngbyaceae cyanobacterium]